MADQLRKDQVTIATLAASMTAAAGFIAARYRYDIEDFLYSEAFSSSAFGAGDAFAAVMWSISLYYCSPLQLLLLFLGKIETERPSDWLLYQVRTLLLLPFVAVTLRIYAGAH